MSGPKFKVDEGVLCYHGPHLYAAKCLDVQEQDGEWMYKVHYIGWNKTWDEYVDDPRILKDNAKNKELQKRLLYLAQVQSKNKGKGSRKKTSGKSKEARNDDKDEEFAREVEEKLALPDKIRKQLVDDWDDIVNHQLETSGVHTCAFSHLPLEIDRMLLKAFPPTSIFSE
ncbi:hypothetical protein SARC_02573 [Sphaeroforma arctica JP610]|uniref:MRG domain-containing protein n=1 Tax=Sphaeroforma arctica JP610 TaxID=667725 RepID=A0A0L0GAG3_9EUKA|nr:hypothetical protein SARC_02573 [Sphaeroforma arctica JP610]KNC85238.1 hypothetical protein SARC_02573 [Sphaeroforma arctica JP610]|eukprot:XP_014159140.1 hypothetical protein SARC_02573 [Sphaeroforma arctica JP610]